MKDEQRTSDAIAHAQALAALHMPHLYRLTEDTDPAIIVRACCGGHSFGKGRQDAKWSYAPAGPIEFHDDGTARCSGCDRVHDPLLGHPYMNR